MENIAPSPSFWAQPPSKQHTLLWGAESHLKGTSDVYMREVYNTHSSGRCYRLYDSPELVRVISLLCSCRSISNIWHNFSLFIRSCLHAKHYALLYYAGRVEHKHGKVACVNLIHQRATFMIDSQLRQERRCFLCLACLKMFILAMYRICFIFQFMTENMLSNL